MLGFQTYIKFFETSVLNFPTIASLKFLEKLSASVLCVPGMYTDDTHLLHFIAKLWLDYPFIIYIGCRCYVIRRFFSCSVSAALGILLLIQVH